MGGGTPAFLLTFLGAPLHIFALSKEATLLFSIDCALFCTFLHSAKNQLCCFQSIAHSLAKHPGVGGGESLPSYSFSLTISSYAARLVSPRSLAASFRASLRSSLAWRMSSSTRSARLCAEFAWVSASAGASGPIKS